MAEKTPTATPRRHLLLWAVISAIAAAVGYWVAELIAQHDTTWTFVGMAAIVVVLTPFFYAINVRNSRI